MVKALKQNKTPKSEITSITGHNTEAGLDAHDSGNGNLTCIDNHKVKPNFLLITSFLLIIVALESQYFSHPESHSNSFSISSKHHHSVFITVKLALWETHVVSCSRIINTQLSLNENKSEQSNQRTLHRTYLFLDVFYLTNLLLTRCCCCCVPDLVWNLLDYIV